MFTKKYLKTSKTSKFRLKRSKTAKKQKRHYTNVLHNFKKYN